jgi:TolA-binding protein
LSTEEVKPAVPDELQKLQQVVADLRKELGVETSELRAHVRDLQQRLEQLEGSRTGSSRSAGRAAKQPKAQRAAKEPKAERGPKASKAERAAAKKARAARRSPDADAPENDESHDST